AIVLFLTFEHPASNTPILTEMDETKKPRIAAGLNKLNNFTFLRDKCLIQQFYKADKNLLVT
ncbi:MAG: hypothetical protein ACJAV5_001505, partial [Vicingaceae bacterium]